MVWNKIRFPNMMLTYIPKTTAGGQKSRHLPNQHVFRCDPKYTKNEIEEYLTKIYQLPVVKVNTVNYDGKYKRAFRGKHVYREKDWKKAIVTLKQ